MIFFCSSIPYVLQNVRIQAVRLVSQLVSAAEENTAGVRAALVVVVEYLRQRRVLDNLARRARMAREAAKTTKDYGDVTSISGIIEAIQKEFQEAAITTSARVCVTNHSSHSHSSSTPVGSFPVRDPHPISLGGLHLPKEMNPEKSSPTNMPQVPDKHSVLSPASPPPSATPLTYPFFPTATLASSSSPKNALNTPSLLPGKALCPPPSAGAKQRGA